MAFYRFERATQDVAPSRVLRGVLSAEAAGGSPPWPAQTHRQPQSDDKESGREPVVVGRGGVSPVEARGAVHLRRLVVSEVEGSGSVDPARVFDGGLLAAVGISEDKARLIDIRGGVGHLDHVEVGAAIAPQHGPDDADASPIGRHLAGVCGW